MRYCIVFCSILALAGEGLSQGRQIASMQPNQFEIGRRTFFDSGPPFDYYDFFIVRPEGNGSSIERIIVTPPANVCFAPAKVEKTRASIIESPSSLLGSRNLCDIPEKELKRELKRCKNCLVFSGADVAVQVQCGTQTRLIRSDILDRDMFDSAPNTPKNTSATMRLLKRLDDAVGPGVMDKPMIAMPDEGKPPVLDSNSEALQDLAAGKYDELFEGAPDKVSELYRDAQKPLTPPSVSLKSSVPFLPEVFVEPKYPPLARVASIEGNVSFKTEIDSTGVATNIKFESGSRFFQGVVTDAVKAWKFPAAAFNQEVTVTLEFALNCHVPRR